jgi:hypothetical protein
MGEPEIRAGTQRSIKASTCMRDIYDVEEVEAISL